MIKANNLWEADRLRKLATGADVVAEIERCEMGQKAAPTEAKRSEWHKKLLFLDKLRRHIAINGTHPDAKMEQFSTACTVAAKAIRAHAKQQHGVSGSLDCPICKSGTLRYSISSHNGHIAAACTTPGCARWIE